MRHTRRHHELHDEAAGAEEEQHAPLAERGGKGEVEIGRREWRREVGSGCKHNGGDQRAPGGEVVYGDEGVSALSDPADGGVDDSGAENAKEGNTNSTEALAGSRSWEVVV